MSVIFKKKGKEMLKKAKYLGTNVQNLIKGAGGYMQ